MKSSKNGWSTNLASKSLNLIQGWQQFQMQQKLQHLSQPFLHALAAEDFVSPSPEK